MTALARVRWDFVRATARDLTREYSAPPIPILEIAEQNGVEVVFADFGKHASSTAGFCDFEERQIVVNDNDNFGRKMFTIAHELGHWVLHKDFFHRNPELYAVLPRMQSPKKNAFETEANLFAAESLVPTHLLQPVKTAGAAQLADIFGVSREMMENRLKNV
jgi:Zn-dependent peptidase ImmA (M78 family)